MRYPKTIMNTITRRRSAHAAALFITLIMISGCGTTTDLSSIVPIDLRNSQDVAGKVLDTTQSILAVAAQGSTTTTSVAGVTTASDTGLFHLAAFSKNTLQDVIATRAPLADPSTSGAIVTTTVACDNGDISVEQRHGSDGTVYTLTFNDCDENSLNVTFKGTMTLSNVQITGDLSVPATPGSLSATFDLNAVQAIDRGGSTSVQGVFNYSISSTDGVTFDQAISGPKLTISRTDDLRILSTFEIAVNQDSNTSAYSYTASGSLYSTALGGSVTFANNDPFTGNNLIADSPDHGNMRITGRSNTNISMTVTTNGNLTLNIDTDGNGTVDETVRTKWVALT